MRISRRALATGATAGSLSSLAACGTTDAGASSTPTTSTSSASGAAATSSTATPLASPASAAPTATATRLPSAPVAAVPAAARAAGFTRPVLNSVFGHAADLGRIDMGQSAAAGYDWYTSFIWIDTDQGTLAQDPQTTLSMQSDSTGGFLRIRPSVSNCNWTISSADMAQLGQGRVVGRVFTSGYFEATIRFTPQDVPTVWTPASWPAVWLASADSLLGADAQVFDEIDIFENINGPDLFVGTVHQWPHSSTDRNHYSLAWEHGAALAGWHTYGVAWGTGYLTWYFDGSVMGTQKFGRTLAPTADGFNTVASVTPEGGDWKSVDSQPRGTYAHLDHEQMVLVLGTGKGHPMDVRSVRVWGR